MCNENRFSESGAPIAPTRCAEYGFLAGRLDIANDFIDAQRDDITRLRAILAPILAHADAHDYAPPLKFSVAACREIKEKVNATQNG